MESSIRKFLLTAAALVASIPSCSSQSANSAPQNIAQIGGTPAADLPALRVSGQRFVDAAGRVIVLRGANVSSVAKVPPFAPLPNVSDLDTLQGWGMNVIRLIFIWEAFETSPGNYNSDYLSSLAAVVDAAYTRGIYTIVDFHQDGFSRFTLNGCGDGFPKWALAQGIQPQTPNNGPSCKNWGWMKTTSHDWSQSFRDFYADKAGVRDRYLSLMGELSTTFASHPGAIGYDLMNEPDADETNELAPLYRDVVPVIRQAQPSAIMFLEPNVQTGIIQTSLPEPAFDNFAYTPHYYDSIIASTGIWLGGSPTTDAAFLNMYAKAAAWNVPLFLGEFGVSATTIGADGYMSAMYNHLDSGFASGAQWNFDPAWTPAAFDGWDVENFSVIDNLGATRANFKVRPFARAISGVPTKFTITEPGIFNPTHSIELDWTNAHRAGTTEIFVPKSAEFGDAQVTIDTTGAGLECAFDSSESVVTCSSPQDGSMTVRIHT